MTRGERVSEVRFSDRVIKYAEISLPELQKETVVPATSKMPGTSRLRVMRYQGL